MQTLFPTRRALTALLLAATLAESEAKAMVEFGYQRTRIEHAIYALLTPEQRQQANVGRRVTPGRSHAVDLRTAPWTATRPAGFETEKP